MARNLVSANAFPATYFRTTVDYICAQQRSSGAIPWFTDAHADPWNHVEAAMGLSIGGRRAEAERAYRWLADIQRPDGSWFASYGHCGNGDATAHVESNYVAYIATGIWHHFLIYRSKPFLQEMWPVVQRAVDYVCDMQSPHGEIYWARDSLGDHEDALVTGCSSIFKSLECAASIAMELGRDFSAWLAVRERLGNALRQRPDRFDRTWDSKSRYAMDWFYPVMTGVVQGTAAKQRLSQRWEAFVRTDLGCLCVTDRPWVTVAESCELTLALLAAGEADLAATLFNWLHRFRNEDGSWWTGYVYDEPELWPLERPTWTAGATLLAADALARHTPAHRLFLQTRF